MGILISHLYQETSDRLKKRKAFFDSPINGQTMKLCRWIIALLGAVSIAAVQGFWPAAAYAEPRLRIGVIAPLTGSIVASGEAVRQSIILADQRYDKSDLVRFEFEDDGFSPKNSVTIARKFIADNVDAIIVFGTPTSLAVAPLTEQARVPLAAISILDRVVDGRQYTVRHFVSWQEENRVLIEEVKRRGYKRVAIVTTSNDASLALRDGFVRDAALTVVLNEEFPREEMDFRAVAARVKSLKPDAVYHLLFSPQGAPFMRSLRDIGCDVPVFAAHNVEDPQEVEAARGAYEKIWYVTGDDRLGRFFFADYRSRYGQYPAMGGANAFDYAKMIIEAAEEGTPVLEKLKGLRDFEGAFGRYGSVPGNAFDLKAVVRSIQGREFKDYLPD